MRIRPEFPCRRRGVLASIAAGACLAVGCASAPPPAAAPVPGLPPLTIAAAPAASGSARMTLVAAADTNPDGAGRPSPVVVRIYQLRNDAAFARADFFDLFDDDETALGPELITRDEYTLAPASERTIDVVVSGETRFVGALAAFRDIHNAEWRALVPAPRGGLDVTVERARVVLSAVVE